MSQGKSFRAAVAISVILWTITSSGVAADPVRLKKAKGTTPKPSAIAYASGSGLVVGKRFVLTNRHIAQDEKGKLFDGFRVYLGPDYQQNHPARVVAVCENYDLALLETAAELPMPAGGLNVLDGLPPLSQRVTAFGFPLGSRFGVGLTTTGGQISRHPVAASKGDDEEDVAVKSALWHDAVLTSGNSGGPLFTSSKVLVGVNFAYLATDSQHALAVPGNVVADFLRQTSAATGITFTNTVEADVGGADPQELTVFIESMVDDVRGRDPDLEGASSIRDRLIANLKTLLPTLPDGYFAFVESGDLRMAFPPLTVADIKPGEIARVRGSISVSRVDDVGMIGTIDGAWCLVILLPGEADKLRTELAKDRYAPIALNELYSVGPPATLQTAVGHEIYALVLLPLKRLAKSSDVQMLIVDEKLRRTNAEKLAEEQAAKRARETARREAQAAATETQRLRERYRARLRHTFTDVTGRFKVDAVVVAFDAESAELIRMEDNRKISVPVERISEADRAWLDDNVHWIRLYGDRLAQSYEGAHGAEAATPNERGK